jgi:ATP-dependent metalloprotease FtsH
MSDPADYERGKQEGSKHAAGTNTNWMRHTFGPILWIGVPLAATWWFIRQPTIVMPFTKAAKEAARRRKEGKSKSNPMSDMMDMMIPLKKRDFRVDVKGTKFAQVVGIPEAKDEVKQYVDFLQDPNKFTRLGARLPKGCLLTGEPGTGKTLLAKAVAGEADVPFFSCSGADFIEVMGGSGPKRVRELFEEARAASPCIVFIDEIDAIGARSGQKGQGGGSISSEENRTINQLLAEIDGLGTGNDAVIVLGATNFQDNIDKALLREGRFDRKINIDMPDLAARKEVFQHYLDTVLTGDKNGKLKDEEGNAVEPVDGISNADISAKLADLTPGISPATAAAIVNEAALQSAISGKKHVEYAALTEAIENTLLGKKHRMRMGGDALKRTSIHECGHAIVGWKLPQQKNVLKVSVQPRGRAAGYTQKAGAEFHEYQTNVTMFTDLCVMMGGRAAEDVVLGNNSTGAQDDLQRATEMALQKLLAFGMSRKTGMLAFHPEELKRGGRMYAHYSEATQKMAEEEASKLVEAAYDTAVEICRKHKDELLKLSDELEEKKELSTPDIKRVWGERPTTPTNADIDQRFYDALGIDPNAADVAASHAV